MDFPKQAGKLLVTGGRLRSPCCLDIVAPLPQNPTAPVLPQNMLLAVRNDDLAILFSVLPMRNESMCSHKDMYQCTTLRV
jgi:hypothetical protein